MKVQVTLNLSKSTPGTHVYADKQPGIPINTVYIKKSALPNPPPTAIVVTVEAAQ